jgi:hypothetical protein
MAGHAYANTSPAHKSETHALPFSTWHRYDKMDKLLEKELTYEEF